MNVSFKLKDKGTVTAPISLSGITAALGALQKALAEGAPPAAPAAAAPAAAGSTAAAPQGQPPGVLVQPRIAQQFKDWAFVCVDADGDSKTREECLLNQDVQGARADQLLLAARVIYALQKEGGKKPTMLLLLPPNAQKEAGIQMSLDGQPFGKGPITHCGKQACQTGMFLTEPVLAALRQGSMLSVVYTGPKGPVTANVSLRGFTAATGALDKYERP
jgi:invasion protein IalB